MSLKVLTSAPYQRLVSLSAMKAELGETGSSNDARILRLLDSTARAFAGYLGWPLARQRYTETFSGNGRRRLLLSARPVDGDSVTVTVDDVAVDADSFSIEDRAQGVIYRSTGWLSRSCIPSEEGEALIAATYKGGWVLTEQLSAWAASTALTAGSWLRPLATQGNPYLLEVTTAGTTASGSEPTWSATPGATTTSGSAVLTTRDAQELPGDLYEVAIVTASQWYNGALDKATGVQYEKADGFELGYDFVGLREAASSLPPFARSVLDSYR